VAAVWTRWEPLRADVRPREQTWRYYILTDPADTRTLGAADLAQLVRGHWEIEYRLHYVLDESLSEDRSRTRAGNAAGPLGCLRRVALGLLPDERGPWPPGSTIRHRQRHTANAPGRFLRHLQQPQLHLRLGG